MPEQVHDKICSMVAIYDSTMPASHGYMCGLWTNLHIDSLGSFQTRVTQWPHRRAKYQHTLIPTKWIMQDTRFSIKQGAHQSWAPQLGQMFSKKQGTGTLQIGAPICGPHMGGNLGKPHLGGNLGHHIWKLIWGAPIRSQSGGSHLGVNLGGPIQDPICGIPICEINRGSIHIGTDTQFGSLGNH